MGTFADIASLGIVPEFEAIGKGVGGLLSDAEGQTDANVKNVADPQKLQAQQQAFIQKLQGQASGGSTLPSAASQMLQNQSMQNQQQVAGTAAATRGANPALAFRNAQLANVQNQAQSNQTAAVARNQEQLSQQQGAQNLLGNTFNTQNSQNLQAGAINAGIQQGNAQRESNFIGGLMNGGGALSSLADGGEVGVDGGGTDPGDEDDDEDRDHSQDFQPTNTPPPSGDLGSPLALFKSIDSTDNNNAGGKSSGGGGGGGAGLMALMATGGTVPPSGPRSHVGQHLARMAKGGVVNALVSPGERYLPPKVVQEVAKGKKAPMKAGEKIPGTPKVSGSKNSYDNDTVPKKLEAGGIVLPRSVTQSKDPGKEAAKFVRAILARKGGLK